MGHEAIIYGRIDGPRRMPTSDVPDLQLRNEEVIANLPVTDHWPWLVRGHFALPAPGREGTYRTQVIHFGASIKDDPGDAACWDEWLAKFESVLRRLYWVSATAHIETDFSSTTRSLTWSPTDAAFDQMLCADPRPVQDWTRSNLDLTIKAAP